MTNLITNKGKNIILNRVFDGSVVYSEPSLFQAGTGTTGPSSTDTVLETPLGSPAAFMSGYPIIDTLEPTVTIRALIDSATFNGEALSEFGVTEVETDLFGRAVYIVIDKTTQIQVIYVEREVF